MDISLSHFQAGRLTEAIAELGAELRQQPTDLRLRTFLFELLCFAGEFDRAEKQLDVLAEQNAEAQLGAVLYKNLLRAHRQREDAFAAGVETADEEQSTISVRINGKNYGSCEDEDLRIGPSFEVYASGAYTRIPYREIEQVEIAAPATLRDLLFIPATIAVKEGSRFAESRAHVHLPALAPSSWKHKDDAVRLGRLSVLEANGNGVSVPYGAKLLICEDEEIPLLDVREFAFVAA
jgi:type VI secretion system protein ImpE